MNFKIAFAAAAALMDVSGAAYADIPAGSYAAKQTVGTIPKLPTGNIALCTGFGETKGKVSWGLVKFSGSALTTVTSTGGNTYTTGANTTSLVGATITGAPVYVLAYDSFGAPTSGGLIATVDLTFVSAVPGAAAGTYTVVRNTTIHVGSNACTYPTKETWYPST